MVDKSKLIANKLILFKQRILYVLITVDVVSWLDKPLLFIDVLN